MDGASRHPFLLAGSVHISNFEGYCEASKTLESHHIEAMCAAVTPTDVETTVSPDGGNGRNAI